MLASLLRRVRDREFQVRGADAYDWVLIWWVMLILQLTYGAFFLTSS